MRMGRYEVSVHNHGFFRLDGGAMFGTVPWALWAKLMAPDEANRILLATRSLVIEDGDRKMIVDLGCGDKWNEKTRAIFCIRNEPYIPVRGVTDVLLTHLHFDHAGGVSRFRSAAGELNTDDKGSQNEIEPCYPGARHYVSAANLENAKHPNVREKASYLAEDIAALESVELVQTSDGDELWPGLTVHQVDGHTRGLQWIRLSAGGETVAFPADLCPTSKHLPVPFVMGYDMCAETSLREKADFLEQAVSDRWVVIFEHDPHIGAARLEFDARGRAIVSETVDLPTTSRPE